MAYKANIKALCIIFLVMILISNHKKLHLDVSIKNNTSIII